MLSDELAYRITQAFDGVSPTAEQGHAIDVFSRFLTSTSPQAVMLLRGAAGTGKTTLAAAIVKALLALKQKLQLLAPTGRAAKVFALYAGHAAFTIHHRIYRQQSAGDLSAFRRNDNLYADTLFMVDEASMIGHRAGESTQWGGGTLLDDLVGYVYGGSRCRMMLIGDTAQLPPVGEAESAALSADVMSGYGLSVYECDLCEVMRQAQQSGILMNATLVRQALEQGDDPATVRVNLKGVADVSIVRGDELIESLQTSYSRAGIDDTIVVCRSNKRANIYNEGIRRMVLDREELLCTGDRLMIAKNNYMVAPEGQEFIANGDCCVVERVRHFREFYGFHFADVQLSFPDYDDAEISTVVMLDTLSSEAPSLTREQQTKLYEQVMADYDDLSRKDLRLKALRKDAYYNALQVKFAYAVTCHKAQGGQWSHVYIDQGYLTADMLTPDYLHWLYTAFTRATTRLFLVNWPEKE